MKKVMLAAYRRLPVIAVVLLVGALYGVCRFAGAVHNYTYEFDAGFSQLVQEQILAGLQSKEFVQKPFQATLAEIQKAYPIIATYYSSWRPIGSVHTVFESCRPVLCMNSDMVISEHKQTLPRAWFSDLALHKLNGFTVEPDAGKDQEITSVVSLPPSAFETYNIVLHDQFTLWLHDKKQPKFSIKFHSASVPTESLLAHCANVKATLENQGAFAGKKARHWVADVRFAKQIITYCV